MTKTDEQITAYLRGIGIDAKPETKPALATQFTMTVADEAAPETTDAKVPCEVWSRIVGYYRPVDAWNKGKQQEFADREVFIVLED